MGAIQQQMKVCILTFRNGTSLFTMAMPRSKMDILVETQNRGMLSTNFVQKSIPFAKKLIAHQYLNTVSWSPRVHNQLMNYMGALKIAKQVASFQAAVRRLLLSSDNLYNL